MQCTQRAVVVEFLSIHVVLRWLLPLHTNELAQTFTAKTYVYQRKALSYSLQRVAESLDVGVATVHRIETLFDETGSVGKRKYLDGHGTHKLTENYKVLILGLVLKDQKLTCMKFKWSCKL